MASDEALKAGEVGFGYIIYGDDASFDGDPNRIIAMAPLPSAKSGFDPTRLDDQWVLVCVDSSVRIGTYAPDRKAKVGNGVRPVIKPPKMR